MRKARPYSTNPVGTKLTAAVLSLTFGLLIWSVHLTLVYGVHTVMCVRGFTSAWIFGLTPPALAIVVITVAALLATAIGARWLTRDVQNGSAGVRQERQFENRVINWIALLASIAMLWAATTAVFVSPCVTGR